MYCIRHCGGYTTVCTFTGKCFRYRRNSPGRQQRHCYGSTNRRHTDVQLQLEQRRRHGHHHRQQRGGRSARQRHDDADQHHAGQPFSGDASVLDPVAHAGLRAGRIERHVRGLARGRGQAAKQRRVRRPAARHLGHLQHRPGHHLARRHQRVGVERLLPCFDR